MARTSAAVYDLYTGLTTSAAGVDNGGTSATEYDAQGRPVKSIAAVGSPLEIWTRTEYDDINRRSGGLFSNAHVNGSGWVFIVPTSRDAG